MSSKDAFDRYSPTHGLDKTTNDVLLIIFGLITTLSFGFAVWATFRTIKMQQDATKQSVRYMRESILDRAQIESQTKRVEQTMDKVENTLAQLQDFIISDALVRRR